MQGVGEQLSQKNMKTAKCIRIGVCEIVHARTGSFSTSFSCKEKVLYSRMCENH
jgi:hypothetical protein